MVATGVIRCGYNYPYVRLVIHYGPFKSFPTFHQEFGRLAWDGKLGISRVITNKELCVEAMHMDPSFVEPNARIMDTNNCWKNGLHVFVNGQPQWCNLILTTEPCDNCFHHLQTMSPQPPTPMAMLIMRSTLKPSSMTEDQLSLINIRQFAAPNEPNFLMGCFFNPNENNVHLSQHCQRLLQAHQCFKCLGQHSRVDCPNLIPLSPDNCPTCHLLHNGQALANIPLHERKYDIKCGGQLQGKCYWVFIWAMWHECGPHMEKAMPSLKNILNARWMATKALGHFVNNFTRLANACICIIEENNCDI
jgi:hypothetical protein